MLCTILASGRFIMKHEYTKEIHYYLLKNKIKNSKIGYMYLVTAIEIGLNNLEKIYYIMKLYEMIAEKYETNVSSVERAIRTANPFRRGLPAKSLFHLRCITSCSARIIMTCHIELMTGCAAWDSGFYSSAIRQERCCYKIESAAGAG